ncbi:MAG: extracellular solute-binding protein [Chloroflexi bacterium]|nr:extracellular solute-binding protein [Chloroflexota bacterium]
MKIGIRWLLLLLAGSSLVLVACGPTATPPPAPVKDGKPAAAARSEWDELVAAAQKEGTVNIYATAVEAGVVPLRQAFKSKYGIDLEFVQGRPAEVQARLTAERRAGLYLADVGHLGETTQSQDIKPLGITQPVSNLLVLPEVKDPRSWIGGGLPFLDKDGHVFMFMTMAIPHSVVSTELVKTGELSSFTDILAPRWKGKIVFSDPTISGTSPNLLAALYKTFGKDKALDIFRQLAAQEPAITRDQRLMLEWVARAKYAIGLGQSMGLFSEFRRARAPIRINNFKEPRFISGGPGNLSVFSNNPHPRATQLYVNWLLSKEGSAIWSKALEYPSARVDVPKEGLDPDTVPRADDIFPDEEQMKLRVELRKTSAEIFGALMK